MNKLLKFSIAIVALAMLSKPKRQTVPPAVVHVPQAPRRHRHSRRVAALGSVLALAITGTATAYFTGAVSGSGSGTVTVATQTGQKLTVTRDPQSDSGSATLLPNGSSHTLAFTIQNPGTQSVTVNHLVASITNLPHGCDPSWFTANVLTSVPQTIIAGHSVIGLVKVTMASDSNDNQDACQGATPTVTLTAS
jgi:hypothetical protein